MGNSSATRLWDHFAALRFKSVKRVAEAIGRLLSYVSSNLGGKFTIAVFLGILARGMNLAALAGTIKIAAVVLFHWTQAQHIADALGFSGDSLTQSSVALIGGAAILVLYILAGLAGYGLKLIKTSLRARCEYLLLESFFGQPQFPRMIANDAIRANALRSIGAYARSTVNLSEAISYAVLCAGILLLLSLIMPMLIVFALAALIPLQLFYLLAGRRANVANEAIKDIDRDRSDVFKMMGPKKNKKKPPVTVEQLVTLRSDYLRLTAEASSKRQTMLKGQFAPDLAFSAVAGLVLATAIVFLSSMETTTEHLIYLLIGFLLIRFLFVFIRNVLSNSQAIIQDLDQLRFVHETVLEGRNPSRAPPTRRTLEVDEDMEEMD